MTTFGLIKVISAANTVIIAQRLEITTFCTIFYPRPIIIAGKIIKMIHMYVIILKSITVTPMTIVIMTVFDIFNSDVVAITTPHQSRDNLSFSLCREAKKT